MIAQAYRVRVSLLALSGVMLVQGCSMSSIFSSYPDQMKSIKQQIDAKQSAKPEEVLEKHRDDADKILYMMERGRVAQIANDEKMSMADYKAAMDQIAINEEKARISLTGGAAQGAALLTNDNAIPYEGDSYERIFLYHFQAMNYLFLKDPDGALVEVRRANLEQKSAYAKYEDEVVKGEEKAKKYQDSNKNFMGSFKSVAEIAGKVKNSFQNAYTFYASGVIYETQGKYDDAYIDYKKALEIYPDNPYVQKDVIRLAQALNRYDDLDMFKKSYNVTPEQPGPNDGNVVIFFEHGFAPVKMQAKVTVAVPTVGLKAIAFPTYLGKWLPEIPLLIQADGKNLGETKTIVNVQAMAAKALQEKLPGMLVRQILRLIAKEKTNETAKKGGQLLGAASQIFNVLTENADRRSWLTLPNDAQIYRGNLEKGEHVLQVTNGVARASIKVNVQPKRTTVIRIVSTGKSLHSDMVVL